MCDMCLGLAARYEELEQVDRHLTRTETQLMAAHLKPASPAGPRPEQLYTEVLSLRRRLRCLLDTLGDDFVARSCAGNSGPGLSLAP